MRLFRLLTLLMVALIGSSVLSACSTAGTASMTMSMPDYVNNAPMRVREAYQFAFDHPRDLANYPCFCGCGKMGHKSNFNCYIKAINPSGEAAFDSHAAGCGICVDITQDVMRLMKQGKSTREIRAYIDATYRMFGPSTNTPLPAE